MAHKEGGSVESMLERITPMGWCVAAMLLVLSVASWYVIYTKVIQFLAFKKDFARVAEKWRGLTGFGAIPVFVKNDKSPLVAMLVDAAFEWSKINMSANSPEAKEELLDDALYARCEAIKSEFSKGLPLLASTAAVAPFIGLLGTVCGIFSALTSFGEQALPGIAQLTGPVGETLIMTALGLVTALPAAFAYHMYRSQCLACSAKIDSLARAYRSLVARKFKVPGV